MTQTKRHIVLTVAVIYLITKVYGTPIGSIKGLSKSLSTGSDRDSSRSECRKVRCHAPARKSDCTRVSKTDTSVPQPEVGKAKCCPVWKCTRKDDYSFVTFHGVDGDGVETVKYSKKNREGGHSTVSSVATNNHDATALAGTDADALSAGVMRNIGKTFGAFGMSL